MTPSLDRLKEREKDVEAQREKLDRELKRRGDNIDDLLKHLKDLRDRQEKARDHRKKVAARERELEDAIRLAKARQLWSSRACIDDCTTWLGTKLVIVTVGARTPWEAVVSSADRTSHADDCGDKLSQAELYWLYTHGQGAPANPPGTGTHEGICDDDFAAITKWQIGDDLPHFAWGLDLGDGPGFEKHAESLGFKVARPYPNEPWHCNLTEDPTPVLRKLKVI